jgi:DNA end-binding protein Ku
MRTWRNAVLNFAVTSIDVGVAPALDKDRSFSFRNLHTECSKPVQQQNFCPTCNKVAETIVKGIEFPKGNFIPVTAEEISSTQPKVRNLIKIDKFVHEDMLNPMLLADPYWLIPREHTFAQAYAAFKVAMLVSHQVGIGTVAFTDKEHPVCLAAAEDGLALWMLHQPEQLKSPDWELPLPADMGLKQAQMIIELMSEPLADSDLAYPTREFQQALVAKKVAGISVPAAGEQEEAVAAVNVLDTLRESIALLQKQKKSGKPKRRAPARSRS